MAEKIPTAGSSRLEPLSLLWRVFAAPQTLMVLLGLLAVALALASLVPQIPPQARDAPQAWLALQSGPLASGNSLIRVLNLYDIFYSFWFRALLALIGLTLFVWVVDSAEFARLCTGATACPPATFTHWGSRAQQIRVASPFEPEETLARLRELLAGLGYRFVEVVDLPVPNLVAVRRGAVLWSRPLAFAALLLALVGLAIVGIWGWQGADWHPGPGDVWQVGHGSSLHLRLDAFGPAPNSAGRLCDYRSEITWLQADAPLEQAIVGVGRPTTTQGVTARQVSIVPYVKLQAWDESGQPLALQPAGSQRALPSEVEVLFPSSTAQPLVLIPGRDLLLTLSFEAVGPQGKPQLQVFLLRNGGAESQRLGTLSQSGSLSGDDLRLDVDLAYRPVLQVSHSPAMGLALGSLAVALVALAVGWLLPPRTIWMAVASAEPDESLVRLLTPAGARQVRWLQRLADRLGEVLADDA